MWTDNETDRDLLNFDGVAATVAEVVRSAGGRPVSIGVSGAWGAGKSSLIKLTKAALDPSVENAKKGERSPYVFVEFNAWLYQGFDDARAALLDVVAERLADEAGARATGVDKVKDFVKRVRWLRLAKLIALPAAAMALGLPPIGVIGTAGGLVVDAVTGKVTGEKLEKADEVASEVVTTAQGLINPKSDSSPPKEIQALRDSFEAALAELDVTLVVLIDDLDRCLPETAVSTLEAIRLLLFLDRTAFVIAADDEMIKYAVSKHFVDLNKPELVTNYFDKLIQIPIRVPTPGIQEVRAYMMMLFVDNSTVDDGTKEAIREGLAAQLRGSWQGKRTDRAFIDSLGLDLPADLVARLDTAAALAPLMVTATGISGNPRLVKRFLNALEIRMAVSKAQGVGVDEAVLAKLLLFERSAPPKLYELLAASVAADPSGRPGFLAEHEKAARAGEKIPDAQWDDPFVVEWLKLAPTLADHDLRGALYVGREHAPVLTDTDRLSPESAKVLSSLIESPDMADNFKEALSEVPRPDLQVFMDQLLEHARQVQGWGVPPILGALLVVVDIDPGQGGRLAGFLIDRPPAQIEPSIVPKVRGYPWTDEVFEAWSSSPEVAGPVKAAIKGGEQVGNVAK